MTRQGALFRSERQGDDKFVVDTAFTCQASISDAEGEEIFMNIVTYQPRRSGTGVQNCDYCDKKLLRNYEKLCSTNKNKQTKTKDM